MEGLFGCGAVARILSRDGDRISTSGVRQLADRVLVAVKRDGLRRDRVFSETDIEILRRYRKAWRQRMGIRRWPPLQRVDAQ